MATSPRSPRPARRGILAGGNFIVDHVKLTDVYPDQEMLANITCETATNGGGPYNLLIDLARMQVDAPLAAAALVGDDPDGERIIDDCHQHHIDTTLIRQNADAPTSYTDVMTVASTGRRTFFHRRGANALLDVDHFDFSKSSARVFHLAYLLLLDKLDKVNADGSTGAAKVLAAARAEGMITCADAVSVDHHDAQRIIAAAALHVDHLLLNEVELERAVGQTMRHDGALDIEVLTAAAERLLESGVKQTVVVHFAEGAIAIDREGGRVQQHAVNLPQSKIVGAVGAGDAFAAGYLWGVHEGEPIATRLRWAVCTAAQSLLHATASMGVESLTTCCQLGETFGYRDPAARHLAN